MPPKAVAAALCKYLSAALSAGVLVGPVYAGTLTTLYNFTDQGDGGDPVAGVIGNKASTVFYGETYYGSGVTCTISPYKQQGCGTVYSFSVSGKLSVLVRFSGPNGANGSIKPLLIGTTLYGATAYGGASDDGVVFSVNTDGSNYQLLHQFSGMDGVLPSGLVAGPGGILYGITHYGGSHEDGVLFSVTSSGVYTVLHNFDQPVGSYPVSLAIASNGMLVGSTLIGGTSSLACHGGCGTIFTYIPSTGAYATPVTFPSSGEQGVSPYVGSFGPGPVIYGGESASLFSLGQKTGLVTLAELDYYTVGTGVQSGPVYAPNGTLYGVLGGSQIALDGLLYSLKDGVIQDLVIFNQSTIGADPVGSPVVTPSGSIVGTTSSSTCNYCGTIWEYTP